MFFFFKQKTAYEMRISDWSSDVCSSDLSWHLAENRSGGRKRLRIEGKAPCEGQAANIENVQDRDAIGGEAQHDAGRPSSAIDRLSRHTGGELVRLAAGAEPDHRAADIDHQAGRGPAEGVADLRQQPIDQLRQRLLLNERYSGTMRSLPDRCDAGRIHFPADPTGPADRQSVV